MLASITTRSPLRTLLGIDAAVSGANGLAYVVAAGPLASLLGIDAAVLRGVGVFLLAFAVAVAVVAAPRVPARRAVLAVIAANAVWAVDSLVVAALGWGSPTATGRAWIVVQAVVVAGLAAAQRWAVPQAD